jgi:hypothetical protein
MYYVYYAITTYMCARQVYELIINELCIAVSGESQLLPQHLTMPTITSNYHIGGLHDGGAEFNTRVFQEKMSNAFLAFGPEDNGEFFSLELTYNYGMEVCRPVTGHCDSVTVVFIE